MSGSVPDAFADDLQGREPEARSLTDDPGI
jgi:hypothetical protein